MTLPLMSTGSSTLNYLLGDHLGSQSITTNSSGARVAEERYMPWGESRYTYGSTPTTYKFTGQRLESSFGLYFYNARWYDAYLNRWIQPDVIIPSETANNTYLIVDYHETQFLEQLNQKNRNRLNDPQTKSLPVPTNSQAFDRYSYVSNNPLKYTDPTGHCWWDLCIVELTFVDITILVIATFVTLEAIQPGNPEAFAQSIVDLTQQTYRSISNSFASISQADKLPAAGDFPYVAPKQKGNPPFARVPHGGFKDAEGNIWRRDKSGHGGPHWDVTLPNGEHVNVNDDGSIRPQGSPKSRR